ncbi:MAG TPA: tetratricopeptide repeat protein [Acidobacteriota bacterium]|nr:tetratricopeptide repeat protein [Acidobacteriota bacterium]
MNKSIGIAAAILLGALLLGASGCGIIDGLKARNHVNEGVAAYSAKEYPEAVEHFKRAVELDPELLDAKLYLAHSYRIQYVPGIPRPDNQALAENAIQTFQEVVEEAPEDRPDAKSNAMASIAGLYDSMGEYEKAKDWFQRRAEIETDNAEPLYGLGTVAYKQANNLTGEKGANVEELSEEERQQATSFVEEGIKALQDAREIRPDYADALEYLNLLYRERSELAENEEEKERWEREASKLSLEALRLRRQQQREEEQKRRAPLGGREQSSEN